MTSQSRRLPAWAFTALGFFPPLLFNARWFLLYCLRNPSVFGGVWLVDFARGTLAPAAAGALLAAVMLGLGGAISRGLGAVEDEPGLGAALEFALGFGAMAGAIFAAGLAGALSRAVLVGLLAAAAVTVAGLRRPSGAEPRCAGPRWGYWEGRPAPAPAAPRPPWTRWLEGVVLYCAFHTAILALAPPTEWDVLAYHLPIPALYLQAGAIREIPWLLHSHWPHLAETLYCLPLALGMDTAAALLHLACCWALVAATFFAARRELGEAAAWTSAAVLAAQPAFLRIAGTAHADGAMALFVFCGGWTLWGWRSRPAPRALALAGLFGGLAASCKLFGAAPLAGWTLWIFARRARSSVRGALQDAALFSACALAVVGPWYAKAWAGSGNPVWPFFSGLFGGRWGASVIEAPYLASTRWPWPPDWTLVARYGPQYLLAPLLVLGILAGRSPAAPGPEGPGESFRMPAFAGAIGRAGLARRARPHVPPFVAFWLIPCAAYAPVVLRQQEAWRFLLPFYPAAAMLAGAWAARAAEAGRAARALAATAVVVALAPALTASPNNELFAVSAVRSRLAPGREPRELYLERSLDHYLPFERIRRDLPSSSRLLLYREVRGYHLGLDYRWGDPLNQAVIPYARLRGPEELRGRLAELGITHVLINEPLAMYRPSARYYDERTTRLMDDALRRYAEPPVRYGPIALYRLKCH